MSDKCGFHGIPPPKTAYELLMEQRRRNPDVTVWMLDGSCPRCGKAMYTNGQTVWCSPECRVPGTYAAFQEDYIR